MTEKECTCPRTRFKNNLLNQLRTWRDQGDWLIVCMDVNKDIYRKSIGRSLTELDDLQMIETVENYTGKKIGATFFRGSKPIDGVWVTLDVVVLGACVMPAGYGIGDHRLYILDFLTSLLIGHQSPKNSKSGSKTDNALPISIR